MENKRLARTQALLGEEKMEAICSSCVMIIGLGAVGGYVLEALARCGVGSFVLVDFDSFEESNINRQILALSSTIGQKKTTVAKQRVLEINPNAKVQIIDCFVNEQNVADILKNKADVVVDAIDSLNPKCCLIEALSKNNITFISSMGAALKTKFEDIKISKLSNTKNCGLAKFVRKRLRKRNIDISKIMCIYSQEQTSLPQSAMFVEENADLSFGRARHSLGSLPTITGIFGLAIANWVIDKIANKSDKC